MFVFRLSILYYSVTVAWTNTEMMKKFWDGEVVMVTQQCLMPLNCVLYNGKNGQLYVMYVLSQWNTQNTRINLYLRNNIQKKMY